MKHIIVGLVAITLGIWGIVLNWYQFLDLLWVLVPMAAVICGVIALLAGISNFSKSSDTDAGRSVEERLAEESFNE
ncbi:Putative membrane protein, magnetosome protein MamI [Desulfamplus magnetovallimortis]|uniref:Magnetosome protein n=2 Tax=Desulfamplus magnetovallimortis TaxID=1246637 RepID=K7Y7I8_9BACT|nr:magnetosome protein MamI [Desulfamplus magnetovallimortis]AFX88993.1 magnetosome protein [Desulfamplus magnetovallimortis BW-1]CCO06709.1 Putative membrane protein, magnetosome protein MamI [Desulfamplus magnetovallimortis BW-1]SLM32760.1 Putative membrane protein, magnetosome protein MamI [Desulfamplus magnetovallimortis]